jgi:hypothetical protein
MNATLSTRQLRLVGLLVLVIVAAGGYMVVSKNKTTTQPTTANTTPAVTTPAQPTPAQSTPAQTTPAPSKPHSQTATPAELRTRGLPVVVARALRKHSVVVVSLSSPGAGVDQMAAAEARAGAVHMKVGFVNLDVRHQRPGIAILHKLGIVDTPAVLVVKRPGAVYADFKGFVDRAVVEQAVADAH